MIQKNNLLGKHISYYDAIYVKGKGRIGNGQREGKVVKITGNTLTVKNAIGEKKRIHPDKFKILGVYYRKKLEMIDWK